MYKNVKELIDLDFVKLAELREETQAKILNEKDKQTKHDLRIYLVIIEAVMACD